MTIRIAPSMFKRVSFDLPSARSEKREPSTRSSNQCFHDVSPFICGRPWIFYFRPRQVVAELCGAGDGIRTHDVLLGKHRRKKAGIPCLLSERYCTKKELGNQTQVACRTTPGNKESNKAPFCSMKGCLNNTANIKTALNLCVCRH